MSLGKLLSSKDLSFSLLVVLLNLLLILFLYQSVFSLELQGDSWQYGWGYQVAYGDSLLTKDSFRNLQTSLAGSYLTFALIKDHFGLSGLAYYSISVILKFLTVIAFYFLINKLVQNRLASLFASILLSVTFVGVETTHWVFNMYAYIGMIFIILGLTVGLTLPEKFERKKWLISFMLIALGIWWGPMRTTGIVIVVLAWSLDKLLLFRTKVSIKNFLYWLVSLSVLLFIYRSFLGLYEAAYTKHYIWDEWWKFFFQYTSSGKYDFLLSPASNVGRILLPDMWLSSIRFYEFFSPYFGLTNFRAIIVPMLLIFIASAWILTKATEQKKKVFYWMLTLGFLWTALVTLIYKLGPPNFPSWQELMFTLWGGYFLVWCLAFFSSVRKVNLLRDGFLLAFLWSFSFVLVPIIQNGGNTFGTLHRYFVVTAATVPLFVGGILTMVFKGKINIPKIIVVAALLITITLHGYYTKQFFDFKAQAHNRYISSKIWNEFTKIVPNKPEYFEKNPTVWFQAQDRLDREILIESLLFGFIFRMGLDYGLDHNIWRLYFENYDTLVTDVKKDPTILNEFYAVKVQDSKLVNITDEIKEKLRSKI